MIRPSVDHLFPAGPFFMQMWGSRKIFVKSSKDSGWSLFRPNK